MLRWSWGESDLVYVTSYSHTRSGDLGRAGQRSTGYALPKYGYFKEAEGSPRVELSEPGGLTRRVKYGVTAFPGWSVEEASAS